MTSEFYDCGVVSLVIEEPSEKRFRTAPYAVNKETLAPAIDIAFSKSEKAVKIVHKMKMEDTMFEGYKTEGECSYVINLRPFYIEGYYNKNLVLTVNQRQLLNYDFHKSFEELLAKARDSAELSLLLSGWEQFSHGCTIACPKGPQSIALDVTFHGLSKCYGLPERYRRFQLESTKRNGKTQPYRLYNLDIFTDKHVNQSLYGTVPFVIASDPEKEFAGAFLWLNASDTYVDFEVVETDSKLHFISETGTLECFAYLGGTALDLTTAHGKVTGTTPMPQLFALGYHQSRWEAFAQEDVENSSRMFEETDIPCDCLWLDIDHTDSKKYFTWDHRLFPKPLEMIQKLKDDGRHLVVIADPHLKADPEYPVYSEALKQGMFISCLDRLVYKDKGR
eukprot:TRINITY_DN5617_c0_g1_i14.p2 TRINITY_DN5617_c0_g1~~TRINITY_DN5617_c0_g1_i14.p2  ORF type:complete len:392 (-),score=80.96 TRINITY_DN5617_c0_g1_i14:1452-2627(-)